MGCNLAVDMSCEFDLIAGSGEALCGIRATGKYFPLARHRASRVRACEKVDLNLPQTPFFGNFETTFWTNYGITLSLEKPK
jgi:hypothetical protein